MLCDEEALDASVSSPKHRGWVICLHPGAVSWIQVGMPNQMKQQSTRTHTAARGKTHQANLGVTAGPWSHTLPGPAVRPYSDPSCPP